jgi:hypothetical protein
VKKTLLFALCAVSLATDAAAQVTASNSRFSVGFAVGRLFTLDGDASDSMAYAPLFRWGQPDGGFGPAFGLGWYTTQLPASLGGAVVDAAELDVRPVMGGLDYTIRRGRISYEVGATAGYTFNKARLLPAGQAFFEAAGAPTVSIDVTNGFAFRPRARVYYDTSSRFTWMVGAGVLFANPEVTLRGGSQSITFNRNLNSVTIEGGLLFALF